DHQKWRLGKEREDWDMWNTSDVHSVRESIPELNTSEPLRVGVRREGWLHFRLLNITPEQFKTASMEVLIEDSLSHKHVAAVTCARHLPRKVWPRPGRMASAGRCGEFGTSALPLPYHPTINREGHEMVPAKRDARIAGWLYFLFAAPGPFCLM